MHQPSINHQFPALRGGDLHLMRKGAILARMVGIDRVHGQPYQESLVHPVATDDEAANNVNGLRPP